jgi:anti-sigma28 factor (negative regulator of flagellin synthesis)
VRVSSNKNEATTKQHTHLVWVSENGVEHYQHFGIYTEEDREKANAKVAEIKQWIFAGRLLMIACDKVCLEIRE